MNNFTGLNIEKIHIIISKNEPYEFHFKMLKRAFDGFILITNGNGSVTNEVLKEHPLNKGDLLLVRKDETYEINFSKPCSYITSGYDILFDDGYFPVELPHIIKCSENQIKSICQMCKIWQTHSWDSYTKCRIMLLELYIEFIKKEIRNTIPVSKVTLATDFIHKNFKRNFTGDEISKYCTTSISYLRSKFFNETGQTITQYRDNLRIESAKEMLISRSFSVSEIALELGFCDVFHFSKVFKKYTSKSPTVFLKNFLDI